MAKSAQCIRVCVSIICWRQRLSPQQCVRNIVTVCVTPLRPQTDETITICHTPQRSMKTSFLPQSRFLCSIQLHPQQPRLIILRLSHFYVYSFRMYRACQLLWNTHCISKNSFHLKFITDQIC